MQHFLINALTGKTIKVPMHEVFYKAIMKGDLNQLNKIGLGFPGVKAKVTDFLQKNKTDEYEDLEVFVMNNWPILKASVYSSNVEVSCTFSGGCTTREAVDATLIFCSEYNYQIIRIFNLKSHKMVVTSLKELKDDDSFAKSKLGSISLKKELQKIAYKLAAIKTSIDVANDIKRAMKLKSSSGYQDWRTEQSGKTLNLSVRDWGRWESDPEKEEFDEDDDNKILTSKSRSDLKQVIEKAQKDHKDFNIDYSTNEKNWIDIDITPK